MTEGRTGLAKSPVHGTARALPRVWPPEDGLHLGAVAAAMLGGLLAHQPGGSFGPNSGSLLGGGFARWVPCW